MKKLALLLFLTLASNLSAGGIKLTPIPTGQILQAQFQQQRYLSALKKPISSQGEMILWRGKGLLWETKTPFPNAILMAENAIYQLEDLNKPAKKMDEVTGYSKLMFEVMSKIMGGEILKNIPGFTAKTRDSNTRKMDGSTLPHP